MTATDSEVNDMHRAGSLFGWKRHNSGHAKNSMDRIDKVVPGEGHGTLTGE